MSREAARVGHPQVDEDAAPLRKILLYEEDGHTLNVAAEIRCIGRLPSLVGRSYVDLDGKPGLLLYQWEAGVSYREVPLRMLSDNEVLVPILRGAAEKGSVP